MKKLGPVGGLLGNALAAKAKRKHTLDTAGKKTRSKPTKRKKISTTKATASTPKGVQKSKVQGKKELAAARKRQQARVAAAKKKQRKK